ncbi:MAG: hypothetical protein ACRC4W_05965 [Treponemataceae bacterium]
MKKVYYFLIFLTCVSCKLATNNPESSLLVGDFESPKMLSFVPVSEQLIEILFSKPVRLYSIDVDLVSDIQKDALTERESLLSFEVETEIIDGTLVKVFLKDKTEIGKKYSIKGVVFDSNDNTLDFLGYITGFNSRIPKLVINEVRNEYSKPRVEFIELLALSDGNLAGVSLYNSHDGEKARYEFPFAEVKAGEYIVLHLRNMEEGTVDEINALDESGGVDALPTARDFWVNNQSARLGRQDVILLEERKDGKLIDALLLIESKYSSWQKDVHEQAAKKAFSAGVWEGGWDIGSAVITDNVTATRTISRQSTEGVNGKDKWIVVDTSNGTPGAKNSSKPFIPKAK